MSDLTSEDLQELSFFHTSTAFPKFLSIVSSLSSFTTVLSSILQRLALTLNAFFPSLVDTSSTNTSTPPSLFCQLFRGTSGWLELDTEFGCRCSSLFSSVLDLYAEPVFVCLNSNRTPYLLRTVLADSEPSKNLDCVTDTGVVNPVPLAPLANTPDHSLMYPASCSNFLSVATSSPTKRSSPLQSSGPLRRKNQSSQTSSPIALSSSLSMAPTTEIVAFLALGRNATA
mmetsp:Transcript_2253/g.3415  ORF Transcript_2253/g.3415 Transcript_2253/m.3415 type:complete len:228 (-) Transcript_2253:714-1397(-)